MKVAHRAAPCGVPRFWVALNASTEGVVGAGPDRAHRYADIKLVAQCCEVPCGVRGAGVSVEDLAGQAPPYVVRVGDQFGAQVTGDRVADEMREKQSNIVPR